MEAQNEAVLHCIHARQHHARQQWIGQGKRLLRHGIHQTVERILLLVNSEQLQIDVRKHARHRIADALHQRTTARVQTRAQNRVSINDLPCGLLQRIHRKLTEQSACYRQVMQRRFRVQLFDKPQTLLRKCGGNVLRCRMRNDRVRL